MYQIFEKSSLIKFILYVGAIAFLIAWFFIRPADLQSWIRVVASGITFASIFVFAIGATPLWRLFWIIIPPLNRWMFPNLNGDWDVTMKSNISTIAKFHPELKKKRMNSTITGKMTVKQSFFSMAILFHGKDGYSNSETLFVSPIKNRTTGKFKLAFLYENKTPTPMNTDEQSHQGAGIVVTRWENDQIILEGQYWTNRNFSRGLNTAGTIEMRRTK